MTRLLDALGTPPTERSRVRAGAQVLLGLAMLGAGRGHLLSSREEFQAQVPDWVPLDADLVVVLSGWVELVLGAALVATVLHRLRLPLGWIMAAFFVAVFPGNVSQYVDGDDAFGLDSDAARATRLVFQPVLVAWALWATDAWAAWRSGRAGAGDP